MYALWISSIYSLRKINEGKDKNSHDRLEIRNFQLLVEYSRKAIAEVCFILVFIKHILLHFCCLAGLILDTGIKHEPKTDLVHLILSGRHICLTSFV